MSPSEDGFPATWSAFLLGSALVLLAAGAVVGLVAAGVAGPGLLDDRNQTADDRTQVDPASVKEQNGLGEFDERLAERFEGRLQRAAGNLSDGQYSEFRESFNSSTFRGLVDSYQSTTDDGDDGSESGPQVDNITRLERALTAYSRHAESYQSTYDEYQAARNNTTSAQREFRLARRLNALQQRVNSSGTRAIEAFLSLERDQRLNFSDAVEGLRTSLRNISRRQAVVDEQSLIETELTVSAGSTDIAFDDPLELDGRLQTANGTAVADRRIDISLNGRGHTVQTDDDGRFSLSYRPVELSLSTQTLSVAYRPNETALYLASETRVTVRVTQADSAVSVTATPRTVQYNDTLLIAGRVAAGGVRAGGIPVRARLGGVFVGNATTNASGGYSIEQSIPDDIATGERSITVRVPLNNQAVAGASGETTVQVRQRNTTLSMSVSPGDGRVVRVTGQLQFENGEPVRNRTISITAGGESLATMATGGNGSFERSIVVPSRLADGTANISAQYDSTASNIGPATAGTALSLSESEIPVSLVGGGVIAVGTVVLSALFIWRRRSIEPSPESEPTVPSIVTSAEGQGGSTPFLSIAREHLDAGDTTTAVRMAYAAARATSNCPDDATHWEFYEHCTKGAYSEETVEQLRTLTECYERAQYMPGEISISVAEQMVLAATTVVDEG